MKGALEELGEEYEGIQSISKIQTQILNLTSGKVNIFDSQGNFRSTYAILKDISEIYNDLSDPNKASLTEILFGKLRSNQGIALISAFQSGQVEKALTTAMQSEGSAYAEQAKWMDSLEAKTQSLKAAAESLANTTLDSRLFKDLLDAGTDFLSLLESIVEVGGTLPVALGLGTTGKMFVSWIKESTESLAQMTLAQKAAAVSSKLLESALTGVGIAFAALLISETIKYLKDWYNATELAHEATKNALDTVTEYSDSLDKTIQRFKELREKASDSSLSLEELAGVKSELLGVQQSLYDAYGEEAEGINLVNGEYEHQIDLLNELNEKKGREWLTANRTAYDTVQADTWSQNGLAHDQSYYNIINTLRGQNANDNIKRFLHNNGIDWNNIQAGAEGYETLLNIRQLLIDNEKSLKAENEWFQNYYLQQISNAISENAQAYQTYLDGIDFTEMYDRMRVLYETPIRDNVDRFLEVEDIVNKINEAAKSGDFAQLAELQNNLFNYEEWFSQYEEDLPEYFVNAWNAAINNIDSNAIDHTGLLRKVLEGSITGARVSNIKGIDISDFLSGGLNGYDSNTQAWYNSLLKVLDETGITLEELVPKFRNLGIITGKTAQEIEEDYSAIIESANTEIANLGTVQSVLASSGTITVDQYNKMIAASEEYASALQVEGEQITFNSRQVRAIAKERANETKNTLKQAQAQVKMQYSQQHNQLRRLLGDLKDLNAEKVEQYKTDIESLQNLSKQITQYDLLVAQIDQATNSLNAYTQAQSETAYGAQYDVASSAYKSLTEGFGSGKVGTKVFEAAVDALVPKEVIDQGIESIHDYYIDTLGQYFLYDDSGNILRDGLENFVQSGIDAGVFSGTLDEWAVNAEVKLQDVADALGLTKDAVVAMFGALEEYGYGTDFTYFDELIESAGDNVVALQQLADQLLAEGNYQGYLEVIKRERDASLAMADNLANQSQIMTEIEQANQDLQTMINSGATDEEISAQLEHLQSLKDKLIEPSELNISIAKDAIQSEIESLQNDLLNVNLPSDVQEHIRQQIQELEEKNDQIEAQFKLDTSEAEGLINNIRKEVDGLTKQLNSHNTINVDTSYASSKINGLISQVQQYRQLVASTPTFSAPSSTSYSTPNFSSYYSGTDTRRRGSFSGSFATGTPGSNYSGTALVGEQGAEMLVRGNNWHLIGQNGAEFTNIRRGDIIFDAAQTRNLLGRGRINSRGRSFVNGTFGRAFVQGGLSGFRSWGSPTASSAEANAIINAVDNAAEAASEVAETNNDYIDGIEKLISSIDREIERLDAMSDIYETYRNQNRVLSDNIAVQTKKLEAQQLAYDKYLRQANAVGLSGEYQNLVKSGSFDIHSISDEELRNKISEFEEWQNKAEDCKDSILEINKNLHDLSLQKLDNITNDFELVQGHLEAIISRQEAVIALNEKMGKSATENNYKEILTEQKEVANYLRGELEQLEKELESQINSGAIVKYDDCWWEWNTNIENIRKNLADVEGNVLDTVEIIRGIRWKDFEKAVEDLDDAESELDDILKLIGDAPLFNDGGSLTTAGKTTLGIYTQQLGTAKKRTAEYKNALVALKRDLDNGNISQEKYNELVKDYSEKQRKAALDTKAAEDAIISLKIQGIDKATEAYEKYIDVQKKDLQAKRDYDKYMDNLNDKTSEINAIRSQISALQGDERNATKVKKLQSQLLKLEDEATQLRSDHEYEILMEGYDKQLEGFVNNQEAEKLKIEEDLAYRQTVIDEEVAQTQGAYDSIYQYITLLSETYDSTVSENLTHPWTSAANAAAHYKETMGDIVSNTQIATSAINTTVETIKNTIAANEKNLESLMTKINQVKTSYASLPASSPSSSSGSAPSGGSTSPSSGSSSSPYVNYTPSAYETASDISNKTNVSISDLNKANNGSVSNAVRNGHVKVPVLTNQKKHTKTQFLSKTGGILKGFATGGIVEMAHRAGEDGIAMVRNGEAIIAADQVGAVKALAENATSLNHLLERVPSGSVGGQINISYGNLIGEYNSMGGDNSREAAKLFRKLFDVEVKRLGNYSKQLGLI